MKEKVHGNFMSSRERFSKKQGAPFSCVEWLCCIVALQGCLIWRQLDFVISFIVTVFLVWGEAVQARLRPQPRSKQET